MDAPLVTVITVVLNDREGLATTIESVRAQDHSGIEHVVIDGGSSDGSAEWIANQADPIDYWVSEPDRGISDAFNKGLAAARGDWINFLNAGDTFDGADSVSRAAAHFEGQRIVTGFARFGNGRLPTRIWRNRDRLVRRALLSHQASFVHRSVFETCGGFDPGFAMRMDYEFWLRALARFEFLFLDEFLVRFEPGGTSGRDMPRHLAEELRANRKNHTRPRLENAVARLRSIRSQLLHRTRARRLWRSLRDR